MRSAQCMREAALQAIRLRKTAVYQPSPRPGETALYTFL